MERRFALGQAGGSLVVREEGTRVSLEADVPDDRRGLYKVYLSGVGGSQLLGTLMPERGRLRLTRTLGISELKQKGCWPLTGGEARLAYSFGQTQSTQSGWSRELNPAALMGDQTLVLAAKGLGGALVRRGEEGFALAVPMATNAPFPMTPLVCFACVQPIEGREYAIFQFNRCGCPMFQNKGKAEVT